MGTADHGRLDLEYVVPLRWDAATSARDAGELSDYLAWLTTVVDVTVVDGSEPDVYRRHHEVWGPLVRHLPPDTRPGPNGKVAGVTTGVNRARHERVVVADDDVRYDRGALESMGQELERADVVRPQCYFDPLVWHARWDTGRSLLNRSLGHDFPGTHGLRRSVFLAAGGYDDRALFENLEMTRTLAAAGAKVVDAPWLFVARTPPATGHFLHQRVRQAYDDFAQPTRLAAELALLPALVVTTWRRPWRLLPWLAAVISLAEVGRRKDGGAAVFEPRASLWAPAWLLERSVTVWLALVDRCTGGARYGDKRLPLAAHSNRYLRGRIGATRPVPHGDVDVDVGEPDLRAVDTAGRVGAGVRVEVRA